jgi:topoisomerase-4 subunit A
MIGRDGRPAQKSLPAILGEWVEFRVATVRRRSEHRLARVLDRIHVLEGRQLALLDIDRVIQVIRQSDNPKSDLMLSFRLSERQAEDILELRLRQLARLEFIKLEQELADLRKQESGLRSLLDTDAALRRQVGKELDEDAQKFGDARRTLIESAQAAAIEAKILDEPVTVIVSDQGFVRARAGHGHPTSAFTFKPGDGLYGAFECRTVDQLVGLGSNGRVYTVAVSSLPSARGDGLPFTSFIDLAPGTRLVGYVAGPGNCSLLLSNSAGTGFVCQLSDLVSRQRAGRQFMNLDPGTEPLRPVVVEPASDDRIACISEEGRLLVFPAPEIKYLASGGRGVILMALEEGERLVAAIACGSSGVVIEGISPRASKPLEISLGGQSFAGMLSTRARKGGLITPRMRPVSIRRRAAISPAGA